MSTRMQRHRDGRAGAVVAVVLAAFALLTGSGEAAFDKAFSDNVLRDDVSLDVDDRTELADQAQLDAARTEPERSTSPSEAGRIEYDENGRPKFRTRSEAARALALKPGVLW